MLAHNMFYTAVVLCVGQSYVLAASIPLRENYYRIGV